MEKGRACCVTSLHTISSSGCFWFPGVRQEGDMVKAKVSFRTCCCYWLLRHLGTVFYSVCTIGEQSPWWILLGSPSSGDWDLRCDVRAEKFGTHGVQG